MWSLDSTELLGWKVGGKEERRQKRARVPNIEQNVLCYIHLLVLSKMQASLDSLITPTRWFSIKIDAIHSIYDEFIWSILTFQVHSLPLVPFSFFF